MIWKWATCKGYRNVSFQSNKDDYRSHSRYVFCLNEGDMSWKTSRQASVANSTIEAEYITASDSTKEVV